MTNFEYLRKLDNPDKLGRYICDHIEVMWDSDRRKGITESNCTLCPFYDVCGRDHNGVVAWLLMEKGSGIKWTVDD